MVDPEIESRLTLAKKIAIEAGQSTLKYFQTDDFEVERKGDGSPLTIADREAERLLRDEIEQAFPQDSIVGEEFDDKTGTSRYGWILDPIDGTKSFISGVPLYGTMVAVEKIATKAESREAVIGSVYFPGLEIGIFASRGGGAWSFKLGKEPIQATVSNRKSLSDSVMVTSSMDAFWKRDAGATYRELATRVYFSRTWGDVYGYFLVATGQVEIMIDPELNVWDAAAVQPILEEAGGQFTDWRGQRRIDGGDAVGTNGLLHGSVIEWTRQANSNSQDP